MQPYQKLEALQNLLRSMDGLAVAFSGGVDSSFLLKVAFDTLKDKVLAITADSAVFPAREVRAAADFAEQFDIRQIVIDVDEFNIEGFADNPVNRCYLCKREMLTRIISTARQYEITWVADGSNADDADDYRPGLAALQELDVISPLRETGLTKKDIRLLSQKMHLSTWDKPAFACLATRIPYGQKISREKLLMVDKAEQYLFDKGFHQIRVRHHGEIARIEVSARERTRFMDERLMDRVDEEFRQIGFAYTTLDLQGYRAGRINEKIKNITGKEGGE